MCSSDLVLRRRLPHTYAQPPPHCGMCTTFKHSPRAVPAILTRTTHEGSTPGAETNWREVNHSRPAPPSSSSHPLLPRSSFSQALTAILVCRLVFNLRTRSVTSRRTVRTGTGMANLTSVLTTFFDAESDGAHLPTALPQAGLTVSRRVSIEASVTLPETTAKGT